MLISLCQRLAWAPPQKETVTTLSCLAFLLMAVYLWFLPIAHTIAIRHLAFFPLVALTFWAAWKRQLTLHLPLALPWLIYASISLLSVSYALDPGYSFGEVKKEIGYSILVLLIAASWVRTLPSLSRIVALLVVGNIFMVGAALRNAFILEPFWRQDVPQIDALDNGVGMFSTYLITVAPFLAAYVFLQPKKHIWQMLMVLLLGNLLALYFTGNRMGLLTLITEFLVIGAFAVFFSAKGSINRKVFLVSALLTLLMGSAAIHLLQIRDKGPSVEDPRLAIWSVAIDNIKNQPFSGGGFGREAFKLRNWEFSKSRGQSWHAHNVFLNKGVQMGLPGVAAFLFLLYRSLRATWPGRARKAEGLSAMVYSMAATAMTIGVVIKNMTDDFFVSDGAFLYWLLIGAVIGALSSEKTSGTESSQP